jgi:hypothetical protein
MPGGDEARAVVGELELAVGAGRERVEIGNAGEHATGEENEEIVDSLCWRCDSKVVDRQIRE